MGLGFLACPMYVEGVRNMMFTAQQENQGQFSIRYPRGKGVMTEWKTPLKAMKVGSGRKLRSGDDIAILSIGAIGNLATDACDRLETDGISVAHYDMRFVKPLDEIMLHEIFGKFKQVITVEDGCIQGGFGSAVIEFMAENGYMAQVTRLGVPDEFIEHGTQNELYTECGYDADAMVKAAQNMLKEKLASANKMVG